MALLRLDSHLRERRGRARSLLVLAMLATATGCMLLERTEQEPEGLRFSHRIHVDEGLECADCHPGATEGEEPGMPALQACLLCHSEIDAEKPPERKVESFFEDGKFRALGAARLPGEVIFPHAEHAARSACGDCHAGIETSERITRDMRLDMDACMACHAAQGACNGCEVCHEEIRHDAPPSSHRHNWKLFHGQAVRSEAEGVANRCELCHTESSCVTCHREEPPQNHNNLWRLRTHGIAAQMDRQKCATCHEGDSCEACHTEMLPQSHSGMWGAPKDTHCLTCHFPLKNNGCVVCHKATPSHALAPPKPPDHTPGMNCRMCHGVTQPLPHVDKGDDCNMCHL